MAGPGLHELIAHGPANCHGPAERPHQAGEVSDSDGGCGHAHHGGAEHGHADHASEGEDRGGHAPDGGEPGSGSHDPDGCAVCEALRLPQSVPAVVSVGELVRPTIPTEAFDGARPVRGYSAGVRARGPPVG